MSSFTLVDVLFPTGERGNLIVEHGMIVAPTARATPMSSAAAVHDASGYLAIPRLVDSHVHLDKTFIGGRWIPHRPAPTLLDRIAAEVALLDGGRVEPVAVRAARLIDLLVANGSTRFQTHVDIGPSSGLRRLEGVLDARDRARGIADIDVVAFPQEGVMRAPGTVELLRGALERGVDAIGGLDPSTLDGDRDGQLDIVFELAVAYGVRIDIHLHEPGDVGASTLRAIAERTAANGLSGRVAVSHAYCLGELPPAEVRSLATDLNATGITLISAVPGGGLRMPYDELEAAGLRIVFGSDNIRDSWSPFGTGDVLERIALAAHDGGWYSDERLLRALDMVTSNAAAMLGEAAPLLRAGDSADFTLVPDVSLAGAVLARPSGRIVFRHGRIVAVDGRVAHDVELAWPG